MEESTKVLVATLISYMYCTVSNLMFYLLHLLENVNPTLVFETRSGDLAVTQQVEGYVMDFPLNPPTQEVQWNYDMFSLNVYSRNEEHTA